MTVVRSRRRRLTGVTGHKVSSKSKLNTSGAIICVLLRKAVDDFAESAHTRDTIAGTHPSKENVTMAADRFSVVLALLTLSAAAGLSGHHRERSPHAAGSPTETFAAFYGAGPGTPRAHLGNRRLARRQTRALHSAHHGHGRQQRGAPAFGWWTPARERCAAPPRYASPIFAANSNAAEWSADGRFVYFLSNRSGSTQVWRVTAGGTAPRSQARNLDAPGADALQVTNLPLDVGSFRVSPKGDRILV